jgi:hypothetical protein
VPDPTEPPILLGFAGSDPEGRHSTGGGGKYITNEPRLAALDATRWSFVIFGILLISLTFGRNIDKISPMHNVEGFLRWLYFNT